jgi:hypothetical protein
MPEGELAMKKVNGFLLLAHADAKQIVSEMY